MKCPKCGYIGFEATDRCRNCGYDFTLSAPAAPIPELPMRSADETGGPLSDLALTPAAAPEGRRMGGGPPLDLDRVIGAPEPSADLPLFDGKAAVAEDLPPLVAPRATPRRPLAVRRPTPDPARLRARPQRDEPRERTATLDLPLPSEPAPVAAPTAPAARAIRVTGADAIAPMGLRLSAALIDFSLLAGIDLLTLYFTLRLCDLTLGDWRILPVLPMALFFVLINGGYLVAFVAAGGQTIGKMAFGLKVVGYGGAPVPVGLSTVRALGCLVSTVCLGAGLIPAVVGADGRAVHDRMADTRVVRVES